MVDWIFKLEKDFEKEIKHTLTNKLLACLISENLAISSSGIDQSKTSKFPLILDSLVLFGSTLWPDCKPHRRATWAGVFPNFSAISTTTGFLRMSLFRFPGEPSGE